MIPRPFRSAALVAASLALALSTSAQAPQRSTFGSVHLDEDFDVDTAAYTAPDWACDLPVPTFGGWLIANSRPDFQASNTNLVQASGGELRCWTSNNSSTGGYLAYYYPVPQLPTSWRLTVRLRNDLDTPSRAVPEVLTNSGPTPGESCNLFPGDDPAGKLGFQEWDMGDDLILRDGNPLTYPIHTGYSLGSSGSYHTVELISTPYGSELRAWSDLQERPAAPLAVGQSLGPARRVLFGGPNVTNFDYSIDFVRLEDHQPEAEAPEPERLLLSDSFRRASAEFVAPLWGCDPPQATTRGWFIANMRADFQATNTNRVQAGGALRCWTTNNSASGGYLAYYKPIPELPTSWRLITKVRVDVAAAHRPVPTVLVDTEPNPGGPCALFPDDIGVAGFQADVGQELILRDRVTYPLQSGYVVPADGSYHYVELISTPQGSELRAWPEFGQRPKTPLVVGASLGAARRVLFAGPNAANFDYSVDFVRLFQRF
jgi:hypothetical protein